MARRGKLRLGGANGRQSLAAARTWCARHAYCTCAWRARPRSTRATRTARRGPRASRARRTRGRGRATRAAGYARASAHHAAHRAPAHAHARRTTRRQLIPIPPSCALAATNLYKYIMQHNKNTFSYYKTKLGGLFYHALVINSPESLFSSYVGLL